jgi:hypothetical protein
MAPRALTATKNLFFPSLQYSTEKILELRGSKLPGDSKILYDPTRETENCGVGLIANLKSKPSRHVVDVADEMLVRMSHRGGCGCDPASGDGAGTYLHTYIYIYDKFSFQWGSSANENVACVYC